MKKTGSSFEEDIYKQLLTSNLAKGISGKVYRKGMRPRNSIKEDVIVTYKTGLDGQIQNGFIVVNTYVPDILSGMDKLQDISRCKSIEILSSQFVETLKISGYKFELTNNIQSFQLEESAKDYEQHFVHIEIYFEYVTF